MTERPAEWLTDPTGRHDHRYWDGTRWTDHVADAGVAATDPYDGPADAVPAAAVTPPIGTSPSGWASTAEPAEETTEPEAADEAGDGVAPSDVAPASVSGWDTASQDESEEADEGTAAAAATTGAWSTPTTTWDTPASTTTGSAWATTPAGEDAPAEDVTEAEEAPAPRWGAAATEVPSSTWDTPTTTTTSPTSTWGRPLPTVSEPTTTVAAPVPTAPERRSRKWLLVVLALGAVVAVVVALVALGDDDDGGTGGADSIAAQYAEQLKAQTSVSDEQAGCVGEYVVDEIGESRIESMRDLEDRTAPPELQEDFDQAVQRAFTECDVDQADLVPRDSSTEGVADAGAADAGTADAPQSQAMTEAQYKDYYQQSLGLADEDASCLAQHSAQAEADGTINEGDGISQFYQWVDECGIDPDQLFQTIAGADQGDTTG